MTVTELNRSYDPAEGKSLRRAATQEQAAQSLEGVGQIGTLVIDYTGEGHGAGHGLGQLLAIKEASWSVAEG